MTIATLTKHNDSLSRIPRGEIETYLRGIVQRCDVSTAPTERANIKETSAEDIFSLLTKREYCYLSKTRARRYMPDILDRLRPAISAGELVTFYYDIGGGYHASIRPGDDALVFRAGLAELFILSQVAGFCTDVRQLYAPGARFLLVVDNLCAALVNDIPVSMTLDYCSSLRGLIDELGLGNSIELLVESENFSLDDYESKLLQVTASRSSVAADPSPQDIDNVSRFLGRPCSKEEAMQRIQRYKDVIGVSENALNSIIDGVHMTQRASPNTLAFRPFPGGDSRVQAGEVALSRSSKGNLRPFLLTSRNASDYACETLTAAGLLPSTIEHITYAEKVE